MNDIRLIFSDCDGTLINNKARLTKRTIDAVKEVSKKDIPFTLISARSPEEMLPYYQKLGLDTPLIGYNGGIVADISQENGLVVLDSQPIHVNEPFKIYLEVKKHFPKISVQVYSDIYRFADSEDDGVLLQNKLTGIKGKITDVERMIAKGAPIHKIMMIGDSEEIPACEAFLKNNLELNSSIHQSGNNYLEVTNEQATKSNAIKKATKQIFATQPEHVMAIGDNYNDWEMLKYAAFGVVMGNAPQEIQNSLHYITTDNDHDGVAVALQKWVL
ncbi:MAG: Cof-type HAD-IIB family hydrolase [Lactobacillales bacterium]|jgi:Cof subfamily protein (haloacid dehalogenase superfamily)|nr:Cof-type HAD-IIB family hydrolase [Lactobacillales bacterium]